ncbi:hypothetical protein OAF34_06145, partial [Pirellulaceae bacterium]|nr:hypothetical protein [Pirellulaceae bacterium]
EALLAAGLTPTTIRFAVGDEAPLDLVRHIIETAKATIDPEVPGFSSGFPELAAVKESVRKHYLDVHHRYIQHQLDEF